MVRTTFTSITPLPSSITREAAIAFLHAHIEMIDLNPLIIDRHTIPAPDHALPEERSCVWYSLTDRISYLPGGYVNGQVSYTCAFHDLPNGLQTHCYAPMGLDIRDRWSVGGTLPGEPKEPVELGLNAPATGLYLREDVDMRCNFVMASFVKKTLKKSHGSLVDKLRERVHAACSNSSSDSSGRSRDGCEKGNGFGQSSPSSSTTSSSSHPRPPSIPSWPSSLANPTRQNASSTTDDGNWQEPPGPTSEVPNLGSSYHPQPQQQQQQYAGQTLGPYGNDSSSSSSVLAQQDSGLHPPPIRSQHGRSLSNSSFDIPSIRHQQPIGLREERVQGRTPVELP